MLKLTSEKKLATTTALCTDRTWHIEEKRFELMCNLWNRVGRVSFVTDQKLRIIQVVRRYTIIYLFLRQKHRQSFETSFVEIISVYFL